MDTTLLAHGWRDVLASIVRGNVLRPPGAPDLGVDAWARCGSRAWPAASSAGSRDATSTCPDDGCSTRCYTRRMSSDISQRELRNDSGDIMRRLDEGETFVVTRNGVPVGELLPLRRHRFVAAETAVAMFRAAPSVDYTRFRDDLDAAASQDPTPHA